MRKSIFLLALFLAGCASFFSPVGPGEVKIKDMTVTVNTTWNRFDMSATNSGEMWTADGLPLDNLWFYTGVADGEMLRKTADSRKKALPKFQAGMAPSEVVELMESYITADGSTFTLDKLAPVTFGGGPGFRFDFRTRRKQDELELRGVGFATIQREKLYMMVYTAPVTHYFEKNLGQIEGMAKSLSIKK